MGAIAAAAFACALALAAGCGGRPWETSSEVGQVDAFIERWEAVHGDVDEQAFRESLWIEYVPQGDPGQWHSNCHAEAGGIEGCTVWLPEDGMILLQVQSGWDHIYTAGILAHELGHAAGGIFLGDSDPGHVRAGIWDDVVHWRYRHIE